MKRLILIVTMILTPIVAFAYTFEVGLMQKPVRDKWEYNKYQQLCIDHHVFIVVMDKQENGMSASSGLGITQFMYYDKENNVTRPMMCGTR